jgi:hypothetical protein
MADSRTWVDTVNSIVSAIQSLPVSEDLVLRATRHIAGRRRDGLFADDPLRKGIARGYLFESVVYERMADICEGLEGIASYSLLRSDVPWKERGLGQGSNDGLIYNNEGEIVVKGDGADLGEFDFLAFDRDGTPLSVEAKVSKKFLKGLGRTTGYKRRLLGLIFGKDPNFLFISPDSIGETAVGSDLSKQGGCYFARLSGLSEVLKGISPSDIGKTRPGGRKSSKGILVTRLPASGTFDLKRTHQELRAKMVGALASGSSVEARRLAEAEILLPRIRLGQLGKDAVEFLLGRWRFTVSETEIRRERLLRTTGIRLVLTLPELRPGFYFGFRHERDFGKHRTDQRVFVKFAPVSRSTLGCERLLFPWSTALFYSLEDEHSYVSAAILARVMETCITDQTVGLRPKWRRTEEYEVLKELFGPEIKWSFGKAQRLSR